MLANVGRLDRLVRIILGALLIALTQADSEFEWGWLGLVPLLTGFARHCPLYALLGISSCRE
jgi:hypothetical protein